MVTTVTFFFFLRYLLQLALLIQQTSRIFFVCALDCPNIDGVPGHTSGVKTAFSSDSDYFHRKKEYNEIKEIEVKCAVSTERAEYIFTVSSITVEKMYSC